MQRPQSHYQVLGVEPTADVRAIKTAYFALVRKFPPETAPEEFQRIREAYEVLVDPERRAGYEQELQSYQVHGAETAAFLRAAEEAMRVGDYQSAEGMLNRLLGDQPEVHEAREMLGYALLNQEKATGALREFEILIEAVPDRADYRLHRAWALLALKRKIEALEAAREAVKVDPKHFHAHRTVGDLCVENEAWKDAIGAYTRAEGLHGGSRIDSAQLRIRKIRVYLLAKQGSLAERELKSLESDVMAENDGDLRRYIAVGLAGIGARELANGKPALGNKVLAHAERLHPEPVLEHPWPSRIRLMLADLPEKSRAWIRSEVARRAMSGGVAEALFRWIGSVILLFAAAMLVQERRDPAGWGPVAWTLFAILPATAILLFLWGLRILGARRESGHGVMDHPLFLLQIKGAALVAWPLVRLRELKATHHHVNGVYTTTNLALDFGGRRYRTAIRGKEQAERFARSILEARGEALDRLARGQGNEEDRDFIPRTLFAEGRPRTPAETRDRRRTIVWAAAGVGLLILSCVGAEVVGRSITDRAAWAQAVGADRADGYRYYLGLFGGHPARKAEAEQVLAHLDERMVADLEQRHGQPAPALRSLLREALRSGTTQVPISIRVSGSPEAAAKVVQRVASRAVSGLDEAFKAELGPTVLRATSASGTTPPVIELDLATSPASGIYRAPRGITRAAIDVRCVATTRVPGQAATSTELRIEPPPELLVTARLVNDEPASVTTSALLQRAVDRCLAAALRGLDLPPGALPPAPAPAVLARSHSPY